MSKIPKEATCIRNTSTWANVKPEYKFDNAKFDKTLVKRDLPFMSPKIDSMLEKIKELDDIDMATDGKYYKHVIYCDIAGSNSAKMIASSLIANDFTLIYDKGIIKKNIVETDKTFGLLTTSVVYKKPLTMRLKKNMMSILNNRPENINGKNMRFIILDSGFKEGIDVFDVKYMHILEPLITKAENTQVIGRGTRYCGQSGLPFVPNVGWTLNIYRYNINYDENYTVHDLYIKHSNQNISAINFVADIEDIMIASAVDTPLTENIHMLNDNNNRFYNSIINKIKPAEYITVKNINNRRNVYNFRKKIYANDKNKIPCDNKCAGILETYKNTEALLLVSALYLIDTFDYDKFNKKFDINKDYKVDNNIRNDKFLSALNETDSKTILCSYINKRQQFCDTINIIWENPLLFFEKKNEIKYKLGSKMLENMESYKRRNKINDVNYLKIKEFINEFVNPIASPPTIKMNYDDLYNYVLKNYRAYKWDHMDITNKCIQDTNDNVKKSSKKYEIVTFSKSQAFVQNFLTVESPYKGMLLYHSVGSGKTCTAIATASNSFSKNGYTILWVTRHTLKEDIWKNMFEKICNIVIRERLQNGEKLPKTKAKRMAMLGKNWIQPVSYKQFTNIIKGKNKFYKQMVAINGVEDPFKKTLIIIDEVHKIYSNSLSALERPNPEVLQDMVQKSYSISGKNSLKLLLMSATPITEDPMSAIKILNLLLEKDVDGLFPENFDIFKKEYCEENGLFTKEGAFGNDTSKGFTNKAAGLISYVNRSNDRSQFAYPIINDIILNIKPGSSSNPELNDIIFLIKNLTERQLNVDNELTKTELNEIAAELKILIRDKKKIDKIKKEPKNIIDFINKCFLK